MKGYPSLFILFYPSLFILSLPIYFIVFLQETLVSTLGFGQKILQA